MRWQVRWDTIGADGKRRQEKRNFEHRGGGRDETDPDVYAEAFAAKTAVELAEDTYISREAGEITLEQFAKQWRRDHVADPASLETIDKHLAHIYDVPRTERTRRAEGTSPIGHRKLRDLAKSPSLMRRWIKSLEAKGLSPGYIHQIGTTLASILNVAVEDGRMLRNPMHAKSVKLPDAPERIIVPWTLQMVTAARDEVDRRHQQPAIVDLGAGAGMRESEVFAFALEDIVFLGADRKILVRRQIKRVKDDQGRYHLVYDLPKGGKEREVPLSDALARRLTEQIKKRKPVEVKLPWQRPGGKMRTYTLLFVGPGGQPWYRQSFQHTWTAARKAAGAPPPPDENGRFHGLRHTFASLEVAAGADILKVAAWLGHTDPGFTLRTYGHFMPDTRDIGRKAVDEFFEPEQSSESASAPDVPSEGES
ncbi:tyrosine-type recombinase/integrase [Actinomadura sp. 21ATH]|uniref:tyrosine-type recombinase/integrase n=1 Tax=Actinomadura sp. 21ATH TaxID=1735444 RepID=UPI0035BFD6E2